MFILLIHQTERVLRIYFIIKEKGGTCHYRGIPNQVCKYPPPGSGPNSFPAMAPPGDGAGLCASFPDQESGEGSPAPLRRHMSPLVQADIPFGIIWMSQAPDRGSYGRLFLSQNLQPQTNQDTTSNNSNRGTFCRLSAWNPSNCPSHEKSPRNCPRL